MSSSTSSMSSVASSSQQLAEPPASRRILLPVDGSKHSDRAVSWFLANLYRPGDFAVLAFVLEPPHRAPTEPHLSSVGDDFVQEGNRAYSEGLKEAARLKAKFYQACREAGELVGSKAGDTLVRYVEESSISCVVIGSRGLGKLRRTFLGSVSEHLLHNAGCAVIVCPGKKSKKESTAAEAAAAAAMPNGK
uniref:Usp domain-containing protein n=1 Tax=Macrostomum lignano TaxID=282301 RepID=A0A1I8ICK9_9PLAT